MAEAVSPRADGPRRQRRRCSRAAVSATAPTRAASVRSPSCPRNAGGASRTSSASRSTPGCGGRTCSSPGSSWNAARTGCCASARAASASWARPAGASGWTRRTPGCSRRSIRRGPAARSARCSTAGTSPWATPFTGRTRRSARGPTPAEPSRSSVDQSSASAFAAKTKSLSVRPSILCVQIVTFTLAPGEEDVGVMVLVFGHLADPDREVERLPEIVEPVRALQVVPVDHLPVAPEPGVQHLQLVARERRHAAPARNALLCGQIAHDVRPPVDRRICDQHSDSHGRPPPPPAARRPARTVTYTAGFDT